MFQDYVDPCSAWQASWLFVKLLHHSSVMLCNFNYYFFQGPLAFSRASGL